MGLAIVTAAAEEPVTTAEARTWARIEGNAEDTILEAQVKTARAMAEDFCRARFVTQTIDWSFDAFPCSSATPLRLPLGPVSAVTWIKYYDEAGTQQTWTASEYILDAAALPSPSRILPAPGYVWPSPQSGRLNAVTVRFAVGYANAAAVPDGIKSWLKMAASWLYEHREGVAVGIASAGTVPLPDAMFQGLAPYRVFAEW